MSEDEDVICVFKKIYKTFFVAFNNNNNNIEVEIGEYKKYVKKKKCTCEKLKIASCLKNDRKLDFFFSPTENPRNEKNFPADIDKVPN